MGAQDYIVLPFDEQTLIDITRRLTQTVAFREARPSALGEPFMPETSSSGPTPGRLCPFDIDAQRFGFRIDNLIEIGTVGAARSASDLPGYISGIAPSRGREVPILDLRAPSAFQRVPSPLHALIVMRVGAQAIGLAVDTVSNIHTTVGAWHPFPKGAVPEDPTPIQPSRESRTTSFWSWMNKCSCPWHAPRKKPHESSNHSRHRTRPHVQGRPPLPRNLDLQDSRNPSDPKPTPVPLAFAHAEGIGIQNSPDPRLQPGLPPSVPPNPSASSHLIVIRRRRSVRRDGR